MNGNGATHTCRYTVFALKREHLSECAHIQPSFAGFFGILLTIFNAFQGCGSAFAQAAKAIVTPVLRLHKNRIALILHPVADFSLDAHIGDLTIIVIIRAGPVAV